ncbi:uncharacterized protein LOC105768653 [Gossypium raimondii]|uniref:uncharacterized protein LOC105768653 n=1 Tax=Gossypium raimondii TaxID=29730 RepID=UPI00227D22A4|nr:uncharacterized protein LOC105768653 [Gossypium raimondii]
MSHIFYPTCRYGTRHVYFPCRACLSFVRLFTFFCSSKFIFFLSYLLRVDSSTTYSNSIILCWGELLTKFPFGDGFCDSLAVICANILHLTSTLLLISLLLMDILRHGFIHGTRTVGSMMLPPGVICSPLEWFFNMQNH